MSEPAAPEATDTYAITVDQDGNLLELARMNGTDTFLMDGGQWVPMDLDAEEEDYPTFYDQTYHEVSEGAIEVYNEHIGEDEIPVSLFEPFIISN